MIRSSRVADLLATLLLFASAAGHAAMPHDTGVLWRVEGTAGPPSHVFGTIHSDDPRVLDLDPALERVLEQARRYAFELDFERDIQHTTAQAMFDRQPPTLDEQRAAGQWKRARAAGRERGIPANALPLMDPWALAVTLSMPPVDPGAMLDRTLFRRAAATGRPITGLETTAEQLALFEDLSEAEQLALLRNALALVESGDLEPMFEQLTAAWLREDLGRLMAISERHPMLPDAERADAFMEQVIDARNARMVERMQPLLEKGGAFVAVGALHLPGENGILRRLERAGYTVTRVD